MDSSSQPSTTTRGDVADKREALLDAALDVIAREGLDRVTTAAIADQAGVAKGTLFVYFETKKELVNELYLELVGRYVETVTGAVDPSSSSEDRLRAYWFALAEWHLDRGSASNVLLQCETSSMLTDETKTRKEEMEDQMVRTSFPNANLEDRDPLYRPVVHALTAGPIQTLANMREKGTVAITDELLEMTFERIRRALEPDA